jgi:hypothetical protein
METAPLLIMQAHIKHAMQLALAATGWWMMSSCTESESEVRHKREMQQQLEQREDEARQQREDETRRQREEANRRTAERQKVREKVMVAMAPMVARVELLDREIAMIEEDLRREEDKKTPQSRYYMSSYRVLRRTGGIGLDTTSIRKKLSLKQQEVSTLKQQIAVLRVKLDAVSP